MAGVKTNKEQGKHSSLRIPKISILCFRRTYLRQAGSIRPYCLCSYIFVLCSNHTPDAQSIPSHGWCCHPRSRRMIRIPYNMPRLMNNNSPRRANLTNSSRSRWHHKNHRFRASLPQGERWSFRWCLSLRSHLRYCVLSMSTCSCCAVLPTPQR